MAKYTHLPVDLVLQTRYHGFMGQRAATSYFGSIIDEYRAEESNVSTPMTLRLRQAEPAVYLPPSIVIGGSSAESLVQLPKVILLIDGDEVADVGWPRYPMPVRRKSLVDNVAQLCSDTGASAQIVFDGSVSPRCPHSRRDQSVEVRLVAENVEPAAALSELVARHSSNRPLVVVSPDPKFAHEDDHRARPLPVVEFLDLFL